MRALKFRAWDTEKWRYTNDLRRIGKLFNVDLDGRITFVDFTKEIQTIIVEQYTGLKDKNGLDIYEGDIVLDYYDGEDVFIVEWDKDTASFILTGIDHIASVSFDNFYSDKDLEIIGNIHENQELLGGGE